VNQDKALYVLSGEITTPPLSAAARREAGYLLRLLQSGEKLSLPAYRPMPVIGARCGELRIVDEDKTWRIMVYLDSDAVLVLEVFAKKTQQTPATVINNCKARLKRYEAATAKE
jgi:phage-related protein